MEHLKGLLTAPKTWNTKMEACDRMEFMRRKAVYHELETSKPSKVMRN